jgi:hypothetical protein
MRKELTPRTVDLIQKTNKVIQHIAAASELVADITADGVIEFGETFDAGRDIVEEITGKN